MHEEIEKLNILINKKTREINELKNDKEDLIKMNMVKQNQYLLFFIKET